jgi:hypothetical protein
MPNYQVMVHHIHIPDYGPEVAIDLPATWQSVATIARQGEDLVLLLMREADQPVTPPGGAPALTSLTPNSVAAGTTPITVDVIGSGFDANSTIDADGSPRGTFYIDDTHLQYTARPDLATPGTTVQITVTNTHGPSNALPFTYT